MDVDMDMDMDVDMDVDVAVAVAVASSQPSSADHQTRAKRPSFALLCFALARYSALKLI